MEPKRDLAIVLKSIQYEERHRIVTALTRDHGQITAIARNAVQSRRFGGAIEPFAASQWDFIQRPHSDLCQLREAHIRDAFEGLRKDFHCLSLASLLNEIMLKLAPQAEPCRDLFRLHSNALMILSNEGTQAGTSQPNLVPIAFLNVYLAKALQWSGHKPRLLTCLQCSLSLGELDADTEVTCLVADAGWICPNCRREHTRHIQGNEGLTLQRLNSAVLRELHLRMQAPIREMTTQPPSEALEEERKKLFHYLEALFIFHIPGFDKTPLKSLRFLGLDKTS